MHECAVEFLRERTKRRENLCEMEATVGDGET
jgi:hypothetical protein